MYSATTRDSRGVELVRVVLGHGAVDDLRELGDRLVAGERVLVLLRAFALRAVAAGAHLLVELLARLLLGPRGGCEREQTHEGG